VEGLESKDQLVIGDMGMYGRSGEQRSHIAELAAPSD
jgi:hypothetical protein